MQLCELTNSPAIAQLQYECTTLVCEILLAPTPNSATSLKIQWQLAHNYDSACDHHSLTVMALWHYGTIASLLHLSSVWPLLQNIQ